MTTPADRDTGPGLINVRSAGISRRVLIASAASATLAQRRSTEATASGLLVTNHASNTAGFIDLVSLSMYEIEAGAAPWGIAVSSSKRAYVSTAEGVAAIDLQRRARAWLAPYASWSGSPSTGEYRPGGMGIAISRDGSRVFSGVYLPTGPSVIEVLDVERREVVATVPSGPRPFQLLPRVDGSTVYSIDHDSYSVTVLDTASLETRILPAAPLGDANGLAGFEKPHYAALTTSGTLLLPFQGQVLLELDPASGESQTRPLHANTHQHGIAIDPRTGLIAIVGTGPAGGASDGASLTVLDPTSGGETIIPLGRPHETCVWLPDSSRVVLTGGYTFGNGGWDGITVVDVDRQSATEWPMGSRPLDVALMP